MGTPDRAGCLRAKNKSKKSVERTRWSPWNNATGRHTASAQRQPARAITTPASLSCQANQCWNFLQQSACSFFDTKDARSLERTSRPRGIRPDADLRSSPAHHARGTHNQASTSARAKGPRPGRGARRVSRRAGSWIYRLGAFPTSRTSATRSTSGRSRGRSRSRTRRMPSSFTTRPIASSGSSRGPRGTASRRTHGGPTPPRTSGRP